ncbi:hypothetical protein PAE9249_03882 [Paenibacillus sp. CECT 9249]|uniref:hypothetical protein n=1 Tax=Paenibacillus sp. CECT 9249 TaxID=2845385 RepID=UPI001E635B32|nr:hypothetical protein [Paenibacillus sp. CECT 9249]CAH0121355.1 hypothetical protein PAE9249_03882 [Paenibacillus sp. CECT 9249]
MKKQYMETYEQLVNIADQMHHYISVCERLIDQMLQDVYLDGGEANAELRLLIHEAAQMQACLLKNYQHLRLIKTILARHIDNNKMEV